METLEIIKAQNELKMFLRKLEISFPRNATSWREATDEIRDFCRELREYYNECVLDVLEGEEGYIEGMDFRSFRAPYIWNRKSHDFIATVLNKMAYKEKAYFWEGCNFNKKNQ